MSVNVSLPFFEASPVLFQLFSAKTQTLWILAGSITPMDMSSESGVKPSQIFVAASGRIGVISECPPDEYALLYKLQRNLATITEPVGGTDHTRLVSLVSVFLFPFAHSHGHFKDTAHHRTRRVKQMPRRPLLVFLMVTLLRKGWSMVCEIPTLLLRCWRVRIRRRVLTSNKWNCKGYWICSRACIEVRVIHAVFLRLALGV